MLHFRRIVPCKSLLFLTRGPNFGHVTGIRSDFPSELDWHRRVSIEPLEQVVTRRLTLKVIELQTPVKIYM
jgi:hypothetical protein